MFSYFLFSLVVSSLSATEPFTIEANEAVYEETLIHLKKGMTLQHQDLFVEAGQAQVGENQHCFLEDNIVAKFHDTVIKADVASADPEDQTILFLSPGRKVQASGKWGEMAAEQLTLQMHSKKPVGLQAVFAKGEVEIVGKNGELIHADSALYLFEEKKITMIKMEEVKGSAQNEKLHFKTKQLEWYPSTEKLHLLGHPKIEAAKGLSIQSDQSIIIDIASREATIPFNQLEAKGHIIAQLPENKLLLDGCFTCDYKNKEIIAEASKFPFRLENTIGAVEAFKGNLKWTEEESLDSFLLENNVRFQGSLKSAFSISLCHIAAEQIHYNHRENQFLLIGKNHERVLLHDRLKNLQVSAPKIKLRRAASGQKEAIQGIGDVRFTFNEGEVKKMKNYFQNFTGKSQ